MGYGNYDVALTVPAGWLVDATGRLQNASEVLSAQTRARLDSAAHSTGVIHVVTEGDRKAGTSTTPGVNGKLTWRYRAERVRDVSWAASPKYLWDATNAVVGDATGDGQPDTAAIYSLYRPEQRISHWDESARYSRHSIEFFSRFLSPYPYPHMTAVDGPTSCGGMEYPDDDLYRRAVGHTGSLRGDHPRDRPYVVSHDGRLRREAVRLDGRGAHSVRPVTVHGRFLQGLRRRGEESEELPRLCGDGERSRADPPRRPLSQLPLLWRGELLQAGNHHGGAPGCAGNRHFQQGVQGIHPALGRTSTPRRTTSSTPSRMCPAGTCPGSGAPGSSRPGNWIRPSIP